MASPRSVFAILAASLTLILPMSVEALPPADEGQSIAVEQLTDTTLTLMPQVPYEKAVLRVSGPDGYALTKTFEASGAIHVDLVAEQEVRPLTQEVADIAHHEAPPSILADGIYNYEVAFYQTAGSPHVHSGMFLVEGGSTVPLATQRSEPTAAGGESPAAAEGVATQEGPPPQATENDFINIEDAAGDGQTFLGLKSTEPDANRWDLVNTSGVFDIRDDGSRRLFIDASGRVGIGTTAPVAKLHVSSEVNVCQVRMEQGTGISRICTREDDGGQFFIQVASDGVFHTAIFIQDSAPSDSLHLRGEGIGIGTDSPAADLDVHDLDGNGTAAFRLTRNSGSSWAAGHNSSGNMVFNKIGSGGAEFTVRERNHPTATLDVQGHVRGTSFISTSSRTLKTAFEAVEPLDVLGKLAALPVSAWRYKTESEGKRHIGPVAEDFQRLFSLGDGKTIATVDADGVLMAAIQGLLQKVDAALAAKDTEIAELRARLDAVEGAQMP